MYSNEAVVDFYWRIGKVTYTNRLQIKYLFDGRKQTFQLMLRPWLGALVPMLDKWITNTKWKQAFSRLVPRGGFRWRTHRELYEASLPIQEPIGGAILVR